MTKRKDLVAILPATVAAAFFACSDGRAVGVDAEIADTGFADAGLPDAGAGADAGSEDVRVPLQGCNTSDPGLICAGAAKVAITPQGFETVKPELLEDHDDCIDGAPTCGEIHADKLIDAYKGAWADNFYVDTNGNGKFDGYWIAGFGASRPIQAVHDDTWARAAVFRRDGKTVAVVSLDVVGLMYSDVTKISRLLHSRNPELGFEGLIVSSTHTHHGPDTIGMWGMTDPYSGFFVTDPDAYLGKINDEYVDWIDEQVYSAVVEAALAMKPATLRAAAVRTGIENLVNDLRDPFVLDDNMTLLDVTAETGERIATLVNWGSHPETLSGHNNFSSSDYPHFLREALENGMAAAGEFPERAGLGGVAIFLQGALGGMASPLHAEVSDRSGELRQREDFERARAIGERLADKAFAALQGAAPVDDTTLSFVSKVIRTAEANKYFWMLFDMGIFRKRPIYRIDPSKETMLDNSAIDTEMAMLRIGPVTFATVPGELFPELAVGGFNDPYPYSFGRPIIDPNHEGPVPDLTEAPAGPYLREIIPGEYKFLLGLGQDELGYMVPLYDFMLDPEAPYLFSAPGDHYEETRSIGPQIVEQVFETMKELSGK
ncbi:MAG: hypothetical protein HY897_26030 [Deltaproteobacteria bacterium]|nr:hypothetical protein [Deltaproteobacteria bacterium]